MSVLEQYFEKFRKNIIGNDYEHHTPYGKQKMIYADWIASGRLYKPIEKQIIEKIGPYTANTHTESSTSGSYMTEAYHFSRKVIKKHVNANDDDILITCGFGMTAAIVKLQRIMGLKICGVLSGTNCIDKSERPVVFITHMEHHSNHTSWYETSAEVVIIEPDKNLLVDLKDLEEKLIKYKDRKVKIGSFTACSNVTGVHTPYKDMAKLMHKYGGICFVDFAANAPYEDIDMNPDNAQEKLDAIFFSPHKFLGGPGSSGVLIFHKSLYNTKSPDQPGGGTVEWTNPWGEYEYIANIEAREDGGTPGFLQSMRIAMAILLKEQMGTKNILAREHELLKIAFTELKKIDKLHILADNVEDRLGVISFYLENIHYNLIVKLLSDRFGIQVRGGCACAGTYGHYLLDVSYEKSKNITSKISLGDLSEKPGWVRLSLHPCMTNAELKYIIDAIKEVSLNHNEWVKDYKYEVNKNEFFNITNPIKTSEIVNKWFKF